MRKLIYVPVIHMSADLGSLAKTVTQRGVADLGEGLWKTYKDAVDGFWAVILNYFEEIDANGVKIYQDGMIADSDIGVRIAQETAKAGSKNYEVVLNLIKKGAILVKTEDFNLVKEERDRILTIVNAKTIFSKFFNFIKYKLIKNKLLEKRDDFIVKQINETLKENETGIIFIGAYHNVREKLPKDIQVIAVKDADKIREYQKLLPFYGKNKDKFEELSRYLVAKVEP